MKQHMRVMFAAVPVALVAGWMALGSSGDVPMVKPAVQQAPVAEVPAVKGPEIQKARGEQEKEPPAVENPGGVATSFSQGDAVVVPVGPGDEVPSPERDDGTVVENDPIEPEQPQTPEWKLEKTVHIASLVDRQIGRIESDLALAESRGDRTEAQRLRVRLARQKHRLEGIRGEVDDLRAAIGGDAVP